MITQQLEEFRNELREKIKEKKNIDVKNNTKLNYLATFKKHDEYRSPDCAWDDILKYIDKDKYKIWMPFYLDGKCGKYIKSLGYAVYHPAKKDFFNYIPNDYLGKLRKRNNKEWILLDGAPFSLTKEIMQRCVNIKMPFVLLMPPGRIDNNYTREIFKNTKIQLKILNPKPYKFTKFIEGSYLGGAIKTDKTTNFKCYWYCWGISEIYDLKCNYTGTYI